MRWAALFAGLLALAAGLLLRLPALAERPMHADEAVHGIKFLTLWQQGSYRYDPHEFHGPSLYYGTLPLAWLSGADSPATLSEGTLRLLAALCGMLLVIAPLIMTRESGPGAAVGAVTLTAISPFMVYYSRYYIHEMLLVLVSFVFLAGTWKWARGGGWRWSLVAGTGLGLMYATKETFVLTLAAAGIASVSVLVRERWLGGASSWAKLDPRQAAVGLGVAFVVGGLLFTSFLSNPPGLVDSVRTYQPWLGRAEGASPHIHPPAYYFQLLTWTRRGGGPVWTELMILLLALIGMADAFRNRPGQGCWMRFLSFYSVALAAVYSVIPYKTPWCALGFWHGFILLAGSGSAVVLGMARGLFMRALLGAALVLGCGHLGWQAWQATRPYAESQRNPFVYAHTLSSVLELVERVDSLAKVAGGPGDTMVKVVAEGGDYWPLPWYLRGYPQVGWYDHVPEDVSASVVIASPSFADEIAAQQGERQAALGFFGLRPGVFLQLHVEAGLWERFLETRARQGP